MKSCLNCKYAEETMFDECKRCNNEQSPYYREIVDERDLCKYGEEEDV